jgi:hypothetical protein
VVGFESEVQASAQGNDPRAYLRTRRPSKVRVSNRTNDTAKVRPVEHIERIGAYDQVQTPIALDWQPDAFLERHILLE